MTQRSGSAWMAGLSFGLRLALAAVASVSLFTLSARADEAAKPNPTARDFFTGGAEGVEALSNTEMAELRGGFRGVLFGVSFFGNATALAGSSSVGAPEGVTVDVRSDNLVQISAGLGQLPAGFNGVLQTTNIIGDMNVVNNNLVINAVFINDPSSLSSILN